MLKKDYHNIHVKTDLLGNGQITIIKKPKLKIFLLDVLKLDSTMRQHKNVNVINFILFVLIFFLNNKLYL